MPEAARSDALRAVELIPYTDLVGRQEIAERLKVTPAGIDTWRRRDPEFPEPVTVLSGTPIWRWSAVHKWHGSTRHHAGRPRKSSREGA